RIAGTADHPPILLIHQQDLRQRIPRRNERRFGLLRNRGAGGGQGLRLQRNVGRIVGLGREGQREDRSGYDEATHLVLLYGRGGQIPLYAVTPFLLQLDYKSVILFTFLWRKSN